MLDLNLFPTVIAVDYIDLADSVKTIFKYAERNPSRSNDKSQQLRHYQRSTQADAQILDNQQLRSLKSQIESQANKYYHDILGFHGDLYITDSWLNICEPGGYQPDHYHANSVVSGTVYVVITEAHPKLEFRNPRLMSVPQCGEIKTEVAQITAYNSGFMSVGNIQNGSVIYWPSYLVHGYGANTADLDRVSISFNLNTKSSRFLYHNPFTLV